MNGIGEICEQLVSIRNVVSEGNGIAVMTRIMHQHAQLTYLVDVLAVDFEIVEHSSAEQKKVSGLNGTAV